MCDRGFLLQIEPGASQMQEKNPNHEKAKIKYGIKIKSQINTTKLKVA